MNALKQQWIQTQVFTLALLMLCGITSAQGTANGPVTNHNIVSGPFVLIGTAVNPAPIDLDPLGPPWTKHLFDPSNLLGSGGTVSLEENILNVGTEPWFDWHEIILPNPTFGVTLGGWSGAATLLVNGSPIIFNAVGYGSANLTLDNFSQPVLPGDVLTIRKTASVIVPFFTPNTPVLSIQQYPTPEPTSAALLGMGSLLLMARRRTTST